MKHLIGTFVVAALASTTFACSQNIDGEEASDSTENAIVGGTVSSDGAWPGAVALYKGSTQACGGTLVASQWVVTAGHCVTTSQTNGGFTKVVLGRNKLSGSGGETITVATAVRHPNYNGSTLDNDIALLRLTSPSSTPVTKIMSASEAATAIVPSAVMTVVGWGTMSEGAFSSSDVLRQVDVPVIGNAQCRTFSSYNRVTDNQICAGYTAGGRDSCQGDSGGPIFQKIGAQYVQAGIVSWGIGCARPNAPGVYTRISNYLDWLKTNSNGAIAGGSAPSPTPSPTPTPTPTPGSFTPFTETGAVNEAQSKTYAYDAPAGTYQITMTGTGDADLYVKKNGAATTDVYDCRPYETGTDETCTITLSSAGSIGILVKGYSQSTSRYTLTGRKQ